MQARATRGAVVAAALIAFAVLASGCGTVSAGGADSAHTSKQDERNGVPSATSAPNPSTVTGASTSTAPMQRVLNLPRRGYPVLSVRKGQSVVLRTQPGGRTIKRLGARTDFGSPTVFSVVHTKGPWAAVPTPLLPNGQLAWVRLDRSKLDAGYSSYSIAIDLSRRLAQLRRNDHSVLRWPVTIGAPGVETPTGRFAVTDTFRGILNPAYGCCALALTAIQPKIPSGWLGGNRIAIHGTYGPLGEAISHGCIRSPNDAVSELIDKVPLGTPVLITQ